MVQKGYGLLQKTQLLAHFSKFFSTFAPIREKKDIKATTEQHLSLNRLVPL